MTTPKATPPESCVYCSQTARKVVEIHEAIVGTVDRTGLLARTEKLEDRAKLHTAAISAAILGLVSFAFHSITKS